jgi:hypothetical protein
LDNFSGPNFRSWLVKFYSQPGRPTLQALVSHLDGDAADFYATVATQQAWDYLSLLHALGRRFDDDAAREKAVVQLSQLKQGTLSIGAFNQQFLHLARLSDSINDSQVVVRYAAACGSRAREVIARRRLVGMPLAEVMNVVEEEVQRLVSLEAQIAGLEGLYVGGGGAAHYAGPEPMELGTASFGGGGRQQQYRPRSPGHHVGGRGGNHVPGDGKCFRCHGEGHLKRECTTPADPRRRDSRRCHRCGGTGHTHDECATPVRHQQQQPRQQPRQQGRSRLCRTTALVVVVSALLHQTEGLAAGQ